MNRSKLKIQIFDGSRQEMTSDFKALITIKDGNEKILVRDEYSSGTIFDLPFYDNLGDNCTVIAYREGYEQCGFQPIHCSPNIQQHADLMLLSKESTFNFADAKWEGLRISHPTIYSLLRSGVDDTIAQTRYSDLLENRSDVLACLFNIMTAMAAIQLPQKTPLDYFQELIWDQTMARDRFFAYADPTLYEQVKLAASHGEFVREPGFAALHKGATDSYKQIQFGEANLQLTFHANNTKLIDDTTCIMMEPDIDYYKDPLAHGLLEVIPNETSGSLTDPRQVYVLRWIAGRHAGVPEFNPPYTII